MIQPFLFLMDLVIGFGSKGYEYRLSVLGKSLVVGIKLYSIKGNNRPKSLSKGYYQPNRWMRGIFKPF